MSTDWAEQDFYGTLQVEPDVDAAELKRAYRRLAQSSHPDANPGDPYAEERFKAIAIAYGILADPSQRSLYDRVLEAKKRGTARPRPRGPQAGETATAEPASAPETQPKEQTGEVEELFDAATAGAVLGQHIITSATLPLEDAARGASVRVGLDNGDEMTVTLPPGVDDGDIIRLPGRGAPAANGKPAGDLVVIVHVPRHNLFDRSGYNLTTRLPVSMSEAAMGAEVTVPTLRGNVTITIPPGTAPGATFQITGYGVQRPTGAPGDLYVVIEMKTNDTMRTDARRGSFAGLVDVLDEELEVIPTIGYEFNPEFHEAVRLVEGGAGRLVVTGEVRRGYTVKGQVIRPALVTVAYAPEELPS